MPPNSPRATSTRLFWAASCPGLLQAGLQQGAVQGDVLQLALGIADAQAPDKPQVELYIPRLLEQSAACPLQGAGPGR